MSHPTPACWPSSCDPPSGVAGTDLSCFQIIPDIELVWESVPGQKQKEAQLPEAESRKCPAQEVSSSGPAQNGGSGVPQAPHSKQCFGEKTEEAGLLWGRASCRDRVEVGSKMEAENNPSLHPTKILAYT